MSEAWVHSLKVAELKEELKKRGEPTTGLKAALVERLLEVIASEAAPSAAQACAPVAEDTTADVTDESPKEDAPDVEAAADERPAPAEVPAVAKDPAPQEPAVPAVPKDPAPQEPEAPAVAKDPAPQAPEPGTAQTTAPAQQQSAPTGQAGAHGMHDAPMNIHALLDDEDGPEEEEPEPKTTGEPAKTAAGAAGSPHADRMDPEEPSAAAEPAQHRSADAESEEAHAKGKRKPLTFAPPERKRSLAAPGGGSDEPAMAEPGSAASPEDPAAKKPKVDVVAAGELEASEPTETNAAAAVRTNILFIDGLMRPFTEGALRQLLSQTGKVTDLWMPGLKTHAVVTFESEEQAEATRAATHLLKWPAGTLKHLMPRFLSAEEAEAEKSGKGKAALAPSPRGQPADKPNARSVLAALKASTEAAATGAKHGGVAAVAVTEAKPAEDGDAVMGARDGDGAGTAAAEVAEEEEGLLCLEDLFRKTVAKPCIYYLPLTDEQVAERKSKALEAEEAQAARGAADKQDDNRKRSRSGDRRR